MDLPKIEIPALRADGTTQHSVVPVGERAGVLIVDDTPSKLVALAAIVSGMELEIVTATSGEQALRQLLKRDFAVILLDVNMPIMSGFETATLIRSRPRSEHMPIIFVTAEANSEAERISGYTLGAVDFIYSPIMPEILRAKVRVFVDLFYLQRQVLLHNEELKARQQELANSNQVLNGLYRIAEGLNQAVSEREVAETALERALELPGIQAGWISLWEGESGFRLAAARNLPPALEAPGALEGDCLCRRQLLAGELDAVNILKCDRLGKIKGDTRGLRYHASIPLWLGDQMVGVMNLAGPQEGAFKEEELKVLRGVGQQVVVALERARLHDHLKKAGEELRESENRFRMMFERTADALLLLDPGSGQFIDCNQAAADMFRCADKKEVLLLHPSQLSPLHQMDGRNSTEKADEMIATALRNGSHRFEWIHCSDHREDFPAEVLLTPILLGEHKLIIATVRDITERKQAEDRLNYLANNDALTGLPNRVLFKERLEQAMIAAKAHDGLVVVVFLDLVRFKNVNDALGHDAGDQMLKAVGQRLLGTVRSGDTVARMSGDEFTIVLTNIGHVDDAARVAQKILHTFEPPFHIAGRELVIGASLGIAIFPLDSGDASELLNYADIAMYSAKAAGGNRYQFYAAEMTARAVDALALENELRQGLERGEFFLNYQPIVDAGGNIVGAEALLRWQHGRRGLIPPARFISLAETTGLILPIGDWVLRQACIQAKAWRKPNGALLRMAVNVSPRQFRHSDLVKTITTILAETGLAPPALDLEITEGVLMQGEPLAQELFHQLRELGLSFSIDDFGTGYSNFAYLKRFPIDSLKIDQSFIRDLTTDPNDAALVKAIIGMAHGLGIKTIAEGVETREQKEFLLAHGCDLMQGYYFSHPLLPEAFTALLDAGKPLPGNDPGGS